MVVFRSKGIETGTNECAGYLEGRDDTAVES